MIQDGLNGINSVDSDNANNFFTLPDGSNRQGLLDHSNNSTSAASMSPASTVTLQAMTSFRVSAAATSSTLPAAAMLFPLSVPNSCHEGSPEAKSKRAGKTSGIKLKTKRPKRKKEKMAGDRVHCVLRSQNPTLFRHKRITRGVETQYILPDDDVAYSSRAVTYLLELAVARGRNKVYLTRR
jgi:hypothetical protein